MTCPRCGCPEWKALSLIHKEGNISTSLLGGGVGVDSDGFGSPVLAIGKGSQQTELSKLASPPIKEMRPTIIMLFLSLVLIIVSIGKGWPVVLITSVIMLLISAGWLIFTSEITESINEAHKLNMIEYENKKMCLRCGDIYIDENVRAHLLDANSKSDTSTMSRLQNANNSHSTLVGRNDPCPCGSGSRFKHCHGKLD